MAKRNSSSNRKSGQNRTPVKGDRSFGSVSESGNYSNKNNNSSNNNNSGNSNNNNSNNSGSNYRSDFFDE